MSDESLRPEERGDPHGGDQDRDPIQRAGEPGLSRGDRDRDPPHGAGDRGPSRADQEPPQRAEDDEEPPGGPFSTWQSLYVTVLLSLVVVIGVLSYLTIVLDHSAP